MKVHLRILTSFFELIKDEKGQQDIVEYISDRIDKVVEKKAKERRQEGRKERSPDKEEIENISRRIFWNMNFFVVYGLVSKIVHSLGSNKLTAIIEKVCVNDDGGSPASLLVKHGILMWYNKNLQTDNLAAMIDQDTFSDTAKKVMRFMVVNHCSMHQVGFREKQRIQHKLDIPSQELLIQESKGDR